MSARVVPVITLFLLAALAEAQPAACPQSGPLSEEQLVTLVKGSVPPARIGQFVAGCGIGFEPAEDAIGRLRSAGTPETVLAVVRAATGPGERERQADQAKVASARPDIERALTARQWDSADAKIRDLLRSVPEDDAIKGWELRVAGGREADRKQAQDRAAQAEQQRLADQQNAAAAALKAEQTLWDFIKDKTDPQLFEQFLRQYPSSRYAPAARQKITSLRPVAPPSNPAPVVPQVSRQDELALGMHEEGIAPEFRASLMDLLRQGQTIRDLEFCSGSMVALYGTNRHLVVNGQALDAALTNIERQNPQYPTRRFRCGSDGNWIALNGVNGFTPSAGLSATLLQTLRAANAAKETITDAALFGGDSFVVIRNANGYSTQGVPQAWIDQLKQIHDSNWTISQVMEGGGPDGQSAFAVLVGTNSGRWNNVPKSMADEWNAVIAANRSIQCIAMNGAAWVLIEARNDAPVRPAANQPAGKWLLCGDGTINKDGTEQKGFPCATYGYTVNVQPNAGLTVTANIAPSPALCSGSWELQGNQFSFECVWAGIVGRLKVTGVWNGTGFQSVKEVTTGEGHYVFQKGTDHTYSYGAVMRRLE